MNYIKKYILLSLTLILVISCQEEDKDFGDLNAPSSLVIQADIQGQDTSNPFGDGSGIVNLTAHADDAISYKFIFSDGTSQNSPSGISQKRFTQTGINVYNITVVASGKGGVATNATISVEVRSDFTDEEAITFLTGGTTKNWYWSASEPAHLGVGPNNSNEEQNYYGFYYQAAPWEKAASTDSDCLYENVLTFTKDGEILKYELNNGGRTFFNSAFKNVGGGSNGGDDLCLSFDASGEKIVSLSPSESVVTMNANASTQTRGTLMNFSDNGFMGYYIGQSTYEILSITANRMVVRAIMGSDPSLAWYHTFTTTQPVQNPPVDYTNLVFSDEFDIDGAPDATKWSYDLGTGDNGWGNDEKQNYTSATANATVTGGNLVITAIKTGSTTYTSARLKSENKFEFTYGKVEVRAKLPTGGGTWPAIWMLGENYDANTGVGWPFCGEIDIMEHKGNEPNVIHGTLHYPGNSGGNGNGNTTTIADASSQFHVYKAIWSPTTIQIFVDDVLFHSVPNSNAVPFNHDFFLILNVAMGGTFGGAIDPSFTQSSMEVDYVRVYQ
ncbi:glycoside hydrolase family 16 protein [Flavobacterium jejuense]|uniref:Glycoside hydrolase family 16 protein n=1 Tax=Flavobacterium jejuense TaxID=1544455 RepID=A0ABX0IRQ4_9FLAO|nr:glycoside hydrolase family 16 protein [Flavobacterium jejuense]NHN24806.1 glycoside hydrolase family 16 protein [Flavobacterium jejuense]